jgi:hypothetical protein
MKLLRPLSPERLALYVAMALVLLFNLPFWQRLWEIVSPLDGHGVKMLALALALTTTFFYWVLLLFVWPRVGKPLIGLLLLTTAAVSYFMNQYGVLIDQDMVRNALQTDGAEVRDLLTIKMALTVLLLGVLPCWLLWKLPVEYRPGWRRLGRRLAHLGVATLALAAIAAVGYQDFASLFRNHRELRMALAPPPPAGAVFHRQFPQQPARQHAQQQHGQCHFDGEQVAHFGAVGLQGVAHHVLVDQHAVLVHEVAHRCGGQQQEANQRLAHPWPDKQQQHPVKEGGGQRQRQRQHFHAMAIQRADNLPQPLPERQVEQQHQRHGHIQGQTLRRQRTQQFHEDTTRKKMRRIISAASLMRA